MKENVYKMMREKKTTLKTRSDVHNDKNLLFSSTSFYLSSKSGLLLLILFLPDYHSPTQLSTCFLVETKIVALNYRTMCLCLVDLLVPQNISLNYAAPVLAISEIFTEII